MVEFERALAEAKNLTAAVLEMYKDDLKKAFIKSSKERIPLPVSLGVKFVPVETGDLKVEASINFVESSVKEKVHNILSNQSEMF